MLNVTGSHALANGGGNGGGANTVSGHGSDDPEHGAATGAGVTALNLNNLHQVQQHNPNGGGPATTFLYEYYKVQDKDALQWR